MTQPRFLRACAATAALLAPLAAAALVGDLDGSGSVDVTDQVLLATAYGSTNSGPGYDPAADLDANGVIDVGDLALFGVAYGGVGAPDSAPPALLVTLNDIPDEMNDLLVVPPDSFVITLLTDSAGGSVVDVDFLEVTATADIGPHPAGTDLAAQFTRTPTRMSWEVPAGSDLDRTSHYITVSVRDLAGNVAQDTYGFAVRDFPFGPPLGSEQLVFLDFGQDRSLGPEIDFVEDLREFGLTTAAAPIVEAAMQDQMIAAMAALVGARYGLDVTGKPKAEGVNIRFVTDLPSGPHARICVGGESSQGPLYLGAVDIDVHNVDKTQQECGSSSGIFPHALDNLWGSDPAFQAAFAAVDPGLGGIPFGQHPFDPEIASPDFDPWQASPEVSDRFVEVFEAADAFSVAVASAIAHETGHTLGLSAPGPAPAGLFGGTAGPSQDHNVTYAGGTPVPNFLMNPGGSFSFEEMSGRSGNPLPFFRPIAWAYLRNRLVIAPQVTGLFQAPAVSGVTPNPAVYPNPYTSTPITILGDGFLAAPTLPQVTLITEGDPTPNIVQNVQWIDAQTLSGTINPYLVPPALYDVRVTNPDGQVALLEDGLTVQ